MHNNSSLSESDALRKDQISAGRQMSDDGNVGDKVKRLSLGNKRRFVPGKNKKNKQPNKPKTKVLKGQDLLLQQFKDAQVTVIFETLNSAEVSGVIEDFDSYTVIIVDSGKERQCLYKHALVKFKKNSDRDFNVEFNLGSDEA